LRFEAIGFAEFLDCGGQVEFDRPALLPAYFEALSGLAFDGFSDFARGFWFALDGTSELAEGQGVTPRCPFLKLHHQPEVIRQGVFRKVRVAVTYRTFLRAAPRVATVTRLKRLQIRRCSLVVHDSLFLSLFSEIRYGENAGLGAKQA
jgi:hypothetical protein